MSRNSGLFWAMLQCSLLWGNIFVFVSFKTDENNDVDDDTIRTTYIVLTVLSSVGVGSFFLLGKPTARLDAQTNTNRTQSTFIPLVINSISKLINLIGY